jgi:hypothetical protein
MEYVYVALCWYMLGDGPIPVQGVVLDVYEEESEASYSLTICSADVNQYCLLRTTWSGFLCNKLTVVDIVQKFPAAC